MKKILLGLFALATIICHANNQPNTKGNIGYMQNKGQVIDQNNNLNPSVKYLFNGNGLNVQLKANGFSYDSYTIEKTANLTAKRKEDELSDSNCIYHYHRIDIEFIGANPSPELVAEQPSTSYTNYYTTGTTEEGVLNVRTFQQVTYKNLYDGIDLQFTINKEEDKGGAKYNFIIHPGADATQIKWIYKGAFNTTLQNGKIILSVEQGNLEERIPTSFISEIQQNINISYVSLNNNVFSFSIPNYDKHTTLFIDPVPWATYYGGSGDEYFVSIAKDSASNLFVTGYTSSTSNIATTGAYQTTYGGGTWDALLAKFNSSGTPQWVTYYGGSLFEQGRTINRDLNGNLLVVGYTSSTSGIATTGAYQTTYGGGTYDAMVLKFTSSGTRLWATYYGGSIDDYGYGIAADSIGNIIFSGYTKSSTGIATSGSYQSTYTANYDAFLVKMNPGGTSVVWGTYYGGGADDQPINLAMDSLGNILICGSTYSPSGIATSGAHQTTAGSSGSLPDAFLAKFSASGSLLWATYYGGSDDDEGLKVIASGSSIILIGKTVSTSGIASTGAYQTTFGGGAAFDVFLVKFNSSGVRQWGTYFGNTGNDNCKGLSADKNGNIFCTGFTTSSTGIATTGAYQTTLSGTGDGFLVKFNPSGSLLWATYFGGSGSTEAGLDAVTDTLGNVFIAGSSNSTTGIATTGAYQTTNGGGVDAILLAFTSAGGLPVKMLSFTAHKQEEDVVLNWQTASEVNNDRFEVERSMSNGSWVVVGKVKGNGTTNEMHNYEFTDKQPFTINHEALTIYYRLKQIDMDGEFEYSDIVALNLNELPSDEFSIYPNPNNGIFEIKTNSTNQTFSIEVYDLIGNKLHQQTLTSCISKIDLSNYSKGIYFLKYVTERDIITRKIIVE